MTIIFGVISNRIGNGSVYWLAIVATFLSGAACLLWLPISINRLYLGSQAADFISNYDPSSPLPTVINFNTFWLYTFCALGGIGLMGVALATGSILPKAGWTVAILTLVGMLVAVFWEDWPPFMSYIILLVLAIGLIQTS
jgi:hypothetical protein